MKRPLKNFSLLLAFSCALMVTAASGQAISLERDSGADISYYAATSKPDHFSQPIGYGDQEIETVCRRIAAKLFSVSVEDCLALNMKRTGFRSAKGTPILYKEYPPLPSRKPLGRVLLIGGQHGDELTSISSVFKWMNKLEQFHSGMFHWHVVPLINPDGALRKKSRRVNQNGVDLNRNLPTSDWNDLSRDYWINRTKRDPRRYPGLGGGSEPETLWLIKEIEEFKPDTIITVHAPYSLVDYDAPDRATAPRSIGMLPRRLLGTYPGSLGNFAGIQKGLPVLTIELPHAWKMPEPDEITRMWVDLVRWLKVRVPVARSELKSRAL